MLTIAAGVCLGIAVWLLWIVAPMIWHGLWKPEVWAGIITYAAIVLLVVYLPVWVWFPALIGAIAIAQRMTGGEDQG